jgi:hypothetical protein
VCWFGLSLRAVLEWIRMAEDKGGCLGLFSRESSKCAVRLIVKQRLIINCVRQPCHGSPNNQVGPNTLGWVTKTQPSKIAIPSHIYRAFAHIPLSTIEITGSQMVLAMKLITFAWNVEDGRHKHEVTSWQLLPFLISMSDEDACFSASGTRPRSRWNKGCPTA